MVVVVWVAPEAPPTPPLMLAPDADEGGRECLRDEDEPQPPVNMMDFWTCALQVVLSNDHCIEIDLRSKIKLIKLLIQ